MAPEGFRVFAVSYDLNATSAENRNKFFDVLKACPSWCRYLESTWLVLTQEGAYSLAERLRQNIDEHDPLLVIQVAADYAGWLPEDAWDWLQRSFRER